MAPYWREEKRKHPACVLIPPPPVIIVHRLFQASGWGTADRIIRIGRASAASASNSLLTSLHLCLPLTTGISTSPPSSVLHFHFSPRYASPSPLSISPTPTPRRQHRRAASRHRAPISHYSPQAGYLRRSRVCLDHGRANTTHPPTFQHRHCPSTTPTRPWPSNSPSGIPPLDMPPSTPPRRLCLLS